MSVFSETLAKMEAERLAKVLRNGLNTGDKSIIDFLKKEVYPLYLGEVHETFGAYKEDLEIRKSYS